MSSTAGPQLNKYTPSRLAEHYEQVMNVSEVAHDLRCSKAHVYNVIRGSVPGVSSLPAITLGRRRLIRRSTLEEWKRSNERIMAGAMIGASPKILP